MRIRFIMSALLSTIAVVGLTSATNVLTTTKIHDPLKKAEMAKNVAFWEAEYLDAIVRRYDIQHQSGEFAGIDPVIYDEFEHLVESYFQNTEDQLSRARSEYNRYQ